MAEAAAASNFSKDCSSHSTQAIAYIVSSIANTRFTCFGTIAMHFHHDFLMSIKNPAMLLLAWQGGAAEALRAAPSYRAAAAWAPRVEYLGVSQN